MKIAQLEILKIKLTFSYHYLRDISFTHVNILKISSFFFWYLITFIIPEWLGSISVFYSKGKDNKTHKVGRFI